MPLACERKLSKSSPDEGRRQPGQEEGVAREGFSTRGMCSGKGIIFVGLEFLREEAYRDALNL